MTGTFSNSFRLIYDSTLIVGRERLKKPRPAPYIKGSPDFASFYSALDKNGYLYKIIEKAIQNLKLDVCAGTKIERKKFPREYVKKYGINNLWKLNLDSAYRLTYTILAEEAFQIPVVLEVLDHKKYNQRFGYRSD